MKKYHFPIVIEKDEHGYFAFSPELQGCYTQGDTYEEILTNMIEDRIENNEDLPKIESVSLSTVEVAV